MLHNAVTMRGVAVAISGRNHGLCQWHMYWLPPRPQKPPNEDRLAVDT